MSSHGPSVQRTTEQEGEPLGYQQIDLSDTAVHTLTIPPRANRATIVVENGAARWRDDATSPDVNTGMIIYPGNYLMLTSQVMLQNFKIIQQSGDQSIINISYYEKK